MLETILHYFSLVFPHSFGRLAINDCLTHWAFVYKMSELVATLDDVLKASGFCDKALVTMDFFMERTLS